MLSCVLLSAGLSSRYGSPKALASMAGGLVIGHLQNLLLATKIDEIVVVLGANAEEIKPHLLKHAKIKSVYNKDFIFGQTSSFKVGLRAVGEQSSGIMLLPVDYPFVQQATLQQLSDAFFRTHPALLIPSYNGKKGHPPIFHSRLRERLLQLADSEGINTVSWKMTEGIEIFPVDDPGVTASFNTPAEFKRLKELFPR